MRSRNPVSRLGELFDATALGLVTLLLIIASFVATWRGMRDFIIGNDLAAGATSQGLVILIVLTLTLAMYVALREVVSPYETPGWWSHIWKRLIALPLYALLALWSIGFGYGFWWSLIAGQSVTQAELETVLVTVREDTGDVRANLVAAASVMAAAEALSDEKAQEETLRGGTCGVNSPPGPGPLARARAETQSRIAALSGSMRAEWLPTVVAQLDDLAVTVDQIASAPSEARRSAFESAYRKTRIGARDISADATARGRSLSAQLRTKADQLAAPPVNGSVSYCYDPDLAAALNAAADEIAGPFTIDVPDFRFSEGAEGVARAVEDLWLGAFARLDPGQEEADANRSAIGGRSLIALMATIGVDFALLIFGVLRGGGTKSRGEIGRRLHATQDGVPAIESPTGLQKVSRPTAIEAQKQVSYAPTSPQPIAISARREAAVRETPRTDDIPDAEYTEIEPGRLQQATFEPDSQLSDEEQLAELLRQTQIHLQEIHTAGSRVAETQAQNRLSDVLRQLKRIGYLPAGMEDEKYQADLHEIVREEPSDRPRGDIIKILRPRFMDAGGKLLLPARVIVSSGRSR